MPTRSKRFEEELTRALASRRQDEADLQRQAAQIERKIGNLVRSLSDAYSPRIRSELDELERQLISVQERIRASAPQAVQCRIRDTCRFVEARLSNLSALWEGEPRIAREEIAKHVGKITLKPMLRTYIATGIWHWLWVPGRVATMVVPGARIAHSSHSLSPSIPFRIEIAA